LPGWFLKERQTAVELIFAVSACFIWSWMEAKKRHRALAEATARCSVWGSPKEAEAVCGALRAQQFHLRSAEVGNQAADSRWLARLIVQHLQLLNSNGLSACVCRSL